MKKLIVVVTLLVTAIPAAAQYGPNYDPRPFRRVDPAQECENRGPGWVWTGRGCMRYAPPPGHRNTPYYPYPDQPYPRCRPGDCQRGYPECCR
jgi:hypothetical protein